MKSRNFKAIAFGLLAYFGLALAVWSCNNKSGDRIVEGYAPVYVPESSLKTVTQSTAQAYNIPGKIYQYGNYTFQVDQGTGIHIIDASNPAQAHKIGFIKIYGASEIAIKDNILYTDNANDLIGIDISNIQNIQVVSRMPNEYPFNDNLAPPFSQVYFECVDNNKGVVVSWKKQSLTNPTCKTL